MTATTEVGLYNLALSLIGSRADVASTIEASREAETCLLWYDDVRNRILHAAPWPSATVVARLDLDLERDTNSDWTEADPAPGWRYGYLTPSDMLRPQYMSSFGRFVEGLDQSSNKKRIFSDVEDAVLVYTKDQTTITVWDHALKMSIVHALAAYIAIPLTGKLQRARDVLEQANGMVVEARLASANSQEGQLESMPEWITARGYSYTPLSRYVYPFGPLLTLTGAPTT